jgi:hypothetical protein
MIVDGDMNHIRFFEFRGTIAWQNMRNNVIIQQTYREKEITV